MLATNMLVPNKANMERYWTTGTDAANVIQGTIKFTYFTHMVPEVYIIL